MGLKWQSVGIKCCFRCEKSIVRDKCRVNMAVCRNNAFLPLCKVHSRDMSRVKMAVGRNKVLLPL